MTETDLHDSHHETTTMPLPPATGLDPEGRSGHPSEGRGNAGHWIGTAIVAMALGFAGGVAGFAVADRQGGTDNNSSTNRSPIAIGSGPITSTKAAKNGVSNPTGGLTPGQIYQAASPAVVHIRAEVSVQSNSIFGVPQQQQGEATGSGFVIDKEGHVVTNAHVVNDATALHVSFDNKKEYGATLVGKDESTDVAVLKVDAKGSEFARGLSPLKFGDSSKVRVGDPVVAIGNPYDLDRTLTTGVISALQRQLQAPNGFSIDNVLQTDAAINPGNSGGPLFNMDGRVIGMNSQIQSKSGGNDGIGFAVPSITVQRITDDILKNGVVKHAWLGLAGAEITPGIAKIFRLPQDKGVLVETVTVKSPASSAGLNGGNQEVSINGDTWQMGGDVITELDGQAVTRMQEIADIINAKLPGDKVKVVYYRDGKKKETTVTLGTRPNTVDQQNG